MERSVALKKLGKLLGKSLGYQVDPKAPDQDDRDEARAKLHEIKPKCDDLRKQMDIRMGELLQGDAEFQRLKIAHAEAAKYCDELRAITNHYRFTVGISNPLFFHVKAQGDSWEEVIAKITKEKQTTK